MPCLHPWKVSAPVLPCTATTLVGLAAMHSLPVAAPLGEAPLTAPVSSMQQLIASSSASISHCKAPQASCLPPGPLCVPTCVTQTPSICSCHVCAWADQHLWQAGLSYSYSCPHYAVPALLLFYMTFCGKFSEQQAHKFMHVDTLRDHPADWESHSSFVPVHAIGWHVRHSGIAHISLVGLHILRYFV